MQPSRSMSTKLDATAIADLYEKYWLTLLVYVRQIVPLLEDAEDVLVEVFLAALESDILVSLEERQQLSWLRRVAYNVDNGVVYVSTNIVGTQTYKVMALGAGDGKQRWQHQIVSGDMPTPYEVNGIVYVVGGFTDCKVYALNSGDGSQVWTLNLGLTPTVDSTVVA